MRRTVAMAALAAGTLGLSSALAFGHSGTSAGRVRICGVERWTVKTLQDRPRLLRIHGATIASLVRRPAPASLPLTRLTFERQVFRVTAAVTLVRSEADGDLHLVLSDGRRTMIAESPDSSCTADAARIARLQMGQARGEVRLCARARITGVAFFDFQHGQTGVAANAIELHPVLGFNCQTSPPPAPLPPVPPPPPPPSGSCAPSYPDECIPPPPPDLDCKDIPYRNFRVLYTVPDPDPHHFDGDHDGVGCET